MAHIQRRQGKKGRSYRVRYTDPEGRERSKTFRRLVEAEAFVVSVSHSMRAGSYIDPAAGQQTVRAYLEEWRAQQSHHRPRTARTTEGRFRTMVYPFIGDVPMGRVRPSTVRTWQAALAEHGYAASTISGVRAQLAGAFLDAVRDRVIGSSPFDGVKAPEVIREKVVPLTVEQVRAGEAAMPDRYRAVNVVVAGTGLRAGEVWGMRVQFLDMLRKTYTVDAKEGQLVGRVGPRPVFGPPKTKTSARTVPLPDRVVRALAAHLTRFPAGPDGLVFTNARGTPITRLIWANAWTDARAVMGLEPGKGLHQLRHFYASALIAAGRSVKEVQERLGHKSAMETLDTYAHLWPSADEGTRAAIDRVFADEDEASGGAVGEGLE